MTLPTRKRWRTENERELVVPCPERGKSVTLNECARCEMCEGIELDASVSVRCGVDARPPRGPSFGVDAPVSTLTTRDVIVVAQSAPLADARASLAAHGIGALVVVDDAKRPVGIVTPSDLLAAPADAQRVLDVMTRNAHAVLETTSIARAAERMATERIHHLLVVDAHGQLCGMLSTFDLARWIAG